MCFFSRHCHSFVLYTKFHCDGGPYRNKSSFNCGVSFNAVTSVVAISCVVCDDKKFSFSIQFGVLGVSNVTRSSE